MQPERQGSSRTNAALSLSAVILRCKWTGGMQDVNATTRLVRDSEKSSLAAAEQLNLLVDSFIT